MASETYTLMRSRDRPREAHDFLRRIWGSSHIRRVFVPEPWEQAAEDLLFQYADQPFSYVDAVSFITMRRLGIREALSFDQDFLIAGFVLLDD